MVVLLYAKQISLCGGGGGGNAMPLPLYASESNLVPIVQEA